jgi:hypothetical protein
MSEFVPTLGNIDLTIYPPDPFLGYGPRGFAHEDLVRRAAADMAGATAIGSDDFHFLAYTSDGIVVKPGFVHPFASAERTAF